jgi:hypothetical protein
MGIKSIKILLQMLLFQFSSLIWAQNNEKIELQNIMIDSFSLENGRYVFMNFGVLTNEKKWNEEYEDYSRQYTESTFDSVIVLSYTNSKNKIFTNWIKVTGYSHKVSINNNVFQVNDSIILLKNIYPKVYEEYFEYISKNKQPKSIIHFGVPIRIYTNNSEEFYYGSIKFGILRGIIKEILIDLRPDGEFD